MGRKLKPPRLVKPAGQTSGIWYVAYKGEEVSTGHTNHAEAIKWMDGWINGKKEQKANEGRWTVGDAEAFYNSQHCDLHVKAAKEKKRRLAKVCDFVKRETFLDQVATEDMTNFLIHRRKDPGIKKGTCMKDSTIWTEISDFKTCRLFSLNRAKFVPDPKRVFKVSIPEQKPRAGDVAVLTKEEVALLLEAAQDYGEHDRELLGSLYLWLVLAIATGRRTNAIETLRWTQVDWVNGIINFLKPGEVESKKVKGSIAINPWLYPKLEQAYNEMLENDPHNPWVVGFPGRKYNALMRLTRKMGMRHVHPHMLRHTYGSWMVRDGANPFEVAEAMSVSIDTAQKYYFHGSAEHLRKLVNKHALPADFGDIKALKKKPKPKLQVVGAEG